MLLPKNKQWLEHLEKEFLKSYFQELSNFIDNEREKNIDAIFPSEENVFRAFDSCDFNEIKVVILGQDPYPTKGHAHGLCFSCDASVKPLPKSLANVFKELQNDLSLPAPSNGDLSFFAEQGVFLINTILTVKEGAPLSHAKKSWETFTDEVISIVNSEISNVVFILWGKNAQSKKALIDTSKHLIIENVHPSPLSAHRGFFGSKPFSQVNKYLVSNKKTPIIWTKEQDLFS